MFLELICKECGYDKNGENRKLIPYCLNQNPYIERPFIGKETKKKTKYDFLDFLIILHSPFQQPFVNDIKDKK